jgi:putative glutamine amidotransferase
MSTKEENKNKKPIIGIIGMRWPDNIEGEMFIMDKTQVHYIDSVQMSGGIPITLPVLEHFDTNIIRSQINLVDGILIQGGVDVTPSLYGEEPVPELDITSKQTDEYILEIIKYAIDRKIPILGICKGMQMINVYFGGTLYQDLKYAGVDGKLHKQTKETITETFHSINVEKNGLLSKIIPDKDKLNVNSYHHQAIKKLGKNIIIDAKADDWIIECIHYNSNDQWILGVQFHPEQLIRKSDEFKPLFDELIKQAILFKNKNI